MGIALDPDRGIEFAKVQFHPFEHGPVDLQPAEVHHIGFFPGLILELGIEI